MSLVTAAIMLPVCLPGPPGIIRRLQRRFCAGVVDPTHAQCGTGSAKLITATGIMGKQQAHVFNIVFCSIPVVIQAPG
jgi:hypothetical protein